jgi:diacylglycerol kinase
MVGELHVVNKPSHSLKSIRKAAKAQFRHLNFFFLVLILNCFLMAIDPSLLLLLDFGTLFLQASDLPQVSLLLNQN